MTRRITPILALLLVLATVPLGGALAQSTTNLRTVDGATKLATEDGVQQYLTTGSVTATVEQIQLTVSVHQTAASANASGIHIDQLNTYLRVDYDENIPRTVRIHVDEAIIAPRPKQDLEPIGGGNATADLQVAEDGAVQSITLHLEGETHAVFTTNNAAGFVTGVHRTATGYVDQFVRNLTGTGLPTLGGGEWQYIEASQLSGTNVSQPLPAADAATMTVQYQAANSSWLSAPECSSDAPVCTLTRGNRTLVVSTTADAPRVRYKPGTDLLAGFRSALNDMLATPGRAVSWLRQTLGGG